VRIRGQIAAAKGDWKTSDGWFREATRQAPSIPFAYSEWADARLARGDAAGAIALYRIAHAREPRFADPLKGWGDALARQGRWGEAVGKYDEALKNAPAWAAARQARAAAAMRAG
jgi:tetratricopeptide (TPR) repeat protein